MLKRPIIIAIAILVAVASIALYFAYRVPPGVAAKSGGGGFMEWATLATSAASTLVAVAGLAQKFIGGRSGRGNS